MKINLDEQELRAINEFLGENWADFISVAIRYLSEVEIRCLEKKLEQL